MKLASYRANYDKRKSNGEYINLDFAYLQEETLYAPIGGTVFFIHNVPLTYVDTAVIKILGDE